MKEYIDNYIKQDINDKNVLVFYEYDELENYVKEII